MTKSKKTITKKRKGYSKADFNKFQKEVKGMGDGYSVNEAGKGMISVTMPAKGNMDLAAKLNPTYYPDDSWIDEIDGVESVDRANVSALDIANLFGIELSPTSSSSGSTASGKSILEQVSQRGAFLLDFFGDPLKALSGKYRDGRAMIQLALHLLKRDHMARRVVEMMSQFSNSRLILRGKQKEIDFFEKWMRRIKMRRVLGKIFKGYYGHSNVTLFRFKTPILNKKMNKGNSFNEINNFYRDTSIKEILEFSNNGKKKYPKDISARKAIWSRNQIPIFYILINPLKIENETPGIFGLGESYFYLEERWIRMIKEEVQGHKSTTKIGKDLMDLRRFPTSFLKKVSDLEKYKNQRIRLDESFAVQIFREKDDWETYATPLVWTALPHLHVKNKLREMDLRTINSVINKILMITIGSPERPATPKQMAYLSKVLKGNHKVLTLLWNHTMTAKFVEPDLNALNINKYESVNRDIKESFGTPDALMGGSSKGFSSTFIEVKAFIEGLTTGREDVLDDFIIPEFEMVAESMSYDSIPKIEFEEMRLRDENKIFEQWLSLVDKGAKSVQTLSEQTGHDWKQEKRRIEVEAKDRKEGKIPVIGVPGAGSPKGGRPESKSIEDVEEPTPKKEVVPQGKKVS